MSKIKADLDEKGELVFTNVPHGEASGDGAGEDGAGTRRSKRAGAGATG